MLEVYTLEKHLENLSKTNEEYEILNSIWKLNKKNLGSALTTVQVTFPHYSLHDSSHSNTILRNIESFLGEERIKTLSPTDTWMLIMAAYTHDLGMIVFYNTLEKKWNEAEFKDFLEEVKEYTDPDLAKSAVIILQLTNNEPNPELDFNFPLKVRTAITLLSAEYFRRTHYYRSNDVLKGMDENFTNILSNFYADQIPNRFLEVLGKIAEAHGSKYEYIFDKLEFQANGIANDKMHPRFVACMLRLGDLLDIDDKRFNKFQENIFGDKLPTSSEIHKKKHAATEHLNISPLGIEATVDCKGNDRVYRIAREWFDWLEEEIKNQNLKWHKIAPKNLGGNAPILSKEKILVLSNGKEPKKGFMNLRFDITPSKVFGILEGKALYSDPEFVFLRELIQNAKDASNIQLWIDIQKGYYDNFIKDNLINRYPNINFLNKNHQQILEAIKFPEDIPLAIYENYPINLNLKWSNASKDFLIIEVIDKGTGISEKNIIRMIGNVGESRKQDLEHNKFKETMPFWLKPTGAFGLGLQSVFLIVKEFDIYTQADGESAIKLSLRSAKNREYCSLEILDSPQQRGSRVEIKIPKNQLEQIYGYSNFNMDVIASFDAFLNDREELYLKKIINYIHENLLSMPNLTLETPYETILDNHIDYENEHVSVFHDQDIQIKMDKTIDFENTEEFVFEITESRIIGSRINLNFIQSFDLINFHYSNPEFEKIIFVRNMHVPDTKSYATSFGLMYCAISINLLDPDSDKMLNIARNKLLAEYYREIRNNIRNELLPIIIIDILKIVSEEFFKLVKSDDKAKMSILYFNALLTAKTFRLDIANKNESILKSLKIPSKIILNKEKKQMNALEFFNINKVAVVSFKNIGIRINANMSDYESLKTKWVKSNNDLGEKVDAILISERYLEDYFWNDGLKVTEILISSDVKDIKYLHRIAILEKTNDQFPFVMISNKDIGFELKELIGFGRSDERRKILPLKEYSILATKNVYISGFEYFNDYTHHGILSPFKSDNEAENIKKDLEAQINEAKVSKNTSSLENLIFKKYIDDLIPINMINWTISNSSFKQDGTLTPQEIKNGYAKLIADYLVMVDTNNIFSTVRA